MKFSDSSQNHKFSDKMLVNNKCYHGKIMLIIFILQTYILIIILNKSCLSHSITRNFKLVLYIVMYKFVLILV
jgi:hypothetical protein